MPSRSLLAVLATLTVAAVPVSALAGTTTAVAAVAAATPAVARAAAPDPGAEKPPLVRATEALDGNGEATLALRDLFVARPTLSDLGSQFAGGLLARPTDGDRDPFADGYRAPATRTCSEHVCVHRVRRTADAADPAWARTTLQVMEDVWTHHVDRLGYRSPATDGRRGGNAKFDVYLKDVGTRGVYGYCAPERQVSGQPQQAAGFCVLDDDFARSQFGRAPRQTLEVTAAHEFFHAVQFAYDYREDQWLLEQTATWMEERYADDVNDNRTYLRYGQLARPGTSLDLFEPSGFAQYGNWTFWEFLSERYGRAVVRRVIQRTGTGGGLPDDYSAQALRKMLKRKGGLPAAFAEYAAGNTRPARTYPEGSAFPSAPVTGRRLSKAAPRIQVGARLDHLSSRTVKIRPDAALRGRRLWVQLKVDAPDAHTAPAAYLVVRRTDGSLRRRPVPLDENGDGAARAPFSARKTTSVTLTLANASTRYRCDRDTGLSCRGEARDERQPFMLQAFLTRATG